MTLCHLHQGPWGSIQATRKAEDDGSLSLPSRDVSLAQRSSPAQDPTGQIYSLKKTIYFNPGMAWWCILVTSALGKLRQEAHKLQASLGYTVRSCLRHKKKILRLGNSQVS